MNWKFFSTAPQKNHMFGYHTFSRWKDQELFWKNCFHQILNFCQTTVVPNTSSPRKWYSFRVLLLFWYQTLNVFDGCSFDLSKTNTEHSILIFAFFLHASYQVYQVVFLHTKYVLKNCFVLEPSKGNNKKSLK